MSLPQSDNRARHLEWQLAEFGHLALPRERPAANVTSAAAAQLRHLGRGVEILFGRVLDAIPYVGTYKVLPERGMSVITCCHLSPGPNGAVGARGISSIPPGSHVWFIYHRDINYGVIIGVESYFMTAGLRALSDYIFPGSRSGLHRDTAHSHPWRMNTRGIGDWSAGKPFDNTVAGEWGAMSETGMRVMIDSFMAQIGAGEDCGVMAFLWDRLCRLTGTNLQIRSNAFEWESLDDESEHYDVRGHVVYPWEVLGAGRQKGDLCTDYSAKETEIDKPWYAAVEPKLDNQMPIRRYMELHGYLGQGSKRLIQAPTDNATWLYGAQGASVTVFEEQLALTGALAVRSAHSVTIAKRPLIPRIKTKLRPDEPEGDNTDNYRASGQWGGGPEHKVAGRIIVDGDDQPLIRATGMQDQLAYVFNWESVHPFFYHKEDYDLEEETDGPLGDAIPTPPFMSLSAHAKMWMPEPTIVTADIDHRYNSVDYALTSSYISLLMDGGVVIGDGFGSEIRMTAGNLHITAPGDVWHKAGRNVVSWGGRDVLIRGKRHVDVTATEQDVRIKAERHNWLLAGNSGNTGMLLLESRATQARYVFTSDGGDPLIGEEADAGGIALRAPRSNIVNWGQEIYLRTGGGSDEDGVRPGDITLDADHGAKNIVTNSNTLVNYLKQADVAAGRYDAFYETPDEESDEIKVVCSHAFMNNNVFIDGNQEVLGFIGVDGPYYGNGWIYLDTGHIATAEAPRYNLLVPPLFPDYFQWWFDELHDDIKGLYTELENFWKLGMIERWYQEQRAGNDDVIDKAEFSFRTADQYKTLNAGDTLNFVLFEDRWQQLARLSESGGLKWEENWTESQGVETAPYPGREVFEKEGSYVELDLTMFDATNGTSNPRGSDDQPEDEYIDPRYGTPTKRALQTEYLVVG